ncbi:MDR family NADP-dependent oxidoreductase [Streptomyces yaizuensis]|uniref:NADP-dependent oxidoreductase n=1 Tax=Streptomyces yaizuensis TaxID=2989713 RepID=A0ABQ5NRX4_9ACTN|nr:NADP-dependent oxidoreductase [Streptomyces sp. YSPA8]GLF92903.1 NADP-dependent oxidoreductase [Streptomyces sp. YSPA8]
MPTAALPTHHREIHKVSRPDVTPTPDNFRLVEVPVPVPGPGQLLVRNRLMSVMAGMSSLMRGGDGLPLPPYEVDAPLWGPALGEVVDAPGPGATARPGDLVTHFAGWREYAVVDAADATPVDAGALPDPAAYLSQGFTAWAGVEAAGVRPGDTVFISGAAGGIGVLAGQFARLRGAKRLVGSVGSQRRAQFLTEELGYDAVVLRGGGSFERRLRAAAPDGIDAVIDNVGGEQLAAALAIARPGARFSLVGVLAAQMTGGLASPVEVDTAALVMRGISLRGLRLDDHADAHERWLDEFGRALREGTVVLPHSRLSGIERAPQALCELPAGRHIGSVLVEL